jgi:hypothetical protein
MLSALQQYYYTNWSTNLVAFPEEKEILMSLFKILSTVEPVTNSTAIKHLIILSRMLQEVPEKRDFGAMTRQEK